MALNKNQQIIKTRNDSEPVNINHDTSQSEDKPFQLAKGADCSWVEAGPFGPKTLRPRIEPWLTALFQSEHFSLLVGSGLTQAVHGIATKEKKLINMDPVPFKNFGDVITREANKSVKSAQRKKVNFEDQLRAASELLRGLEIQQHKQAPDLKGELEEKIRSFAESILRGEFSLVSASTGKRKEAFNCFVSFLMSFASRTGTRERLHIFTTNYDRYIEAGADVAGLRLMDRFVGTLAPIFRASRLDVDLHYNPPGIRGEPRYLEGVARLTKLHGSVDWVDYDRTVRRMGLPFGAQEIGPYLTAARLKETDALQLMIYPNAAKDRETADYPYVELFRDFATAVCRPNSTLVCYGYGFGDEHINRVIEDMLTIPSTHLVVISHDDPYDKIMKRMYSKLGRRAQITLLIGDHLGDLKALVDYYLPKPAIDRTTIRMAKLLKDRWSESGNDKHNDADTNIGDSME